MEWNLCWKSSVFLLWKKFSKSFYFKVIGISTLCCSLTLSFFPLRVPGRFHYNYLQKNIIWFMNDTGSFTLPRSWKKFPLLVCYAAVVKWFSVLLLLFCRQWHRNRIQVVGEKIKFSIILLQIVTDNFSVLLYLHGVATSGQDSLSPYEEFSPHP